MLFIAMRFVRGGDLRLVLEREGALPPGRVAGFLSAVASALDAAHSAGLVHRDGFSANISGGCAPGPARPRVPVGLRGEQGSHVVGQDLTGAGQFVGTPSYSAPEQIQGRAVDGRTDQYALACVAYQLLTGAVPFERDQGMAVLLAHLSEPPRRRWVRGGRACPMPRIRFLPRGWQRARRTGMGPAGISRTRCERRSAWRPTISLGSAPRSRSPANRDRLAATRAPRTGPGRDRKRSRPGWSGGRCNHRLGARQQAGQCCRRACGGSHRYRARRPGRPPRYSRNCRNGQGG